MATTPTVSPDQAVGELLTFLRTTAESVTAFGAEQLPLVAQEILAWSVAFAWLRIAVGIGLIVLALFFMLCFFFAVREGDDAQVGFAVFSLALLASGLLTGGAGAYDKIRVNTAPRLVVIDYLTDTIRSTQRP